MPERGFHAIEPGLIGVRHDELVSSPVALRHVHPEQPRELCIDGQSHGQGGARTPVSQRIGCAEQRDHAELACDVHGQAIVGPVVVGVAVTGAPQTREHLVTTMLEHCRDGRAFAHEARVFGFRNQREEVDLARRRFRIGDSARDCDAGSFSQRTCAHLCKPAVAIKGEEVVAGGDAHPPPRRELDLEDPIGRTLVPTRDRVIPDIEGVGIEGDDVTLQLLVDHFPDRSGLQMSVDEHHDGLARGQARMYEKAETAQRRLPFESGDEVVGEGDAFQGAAEHELAGVEDEGAVLRDLDQLGEVFLRLLRVDVRRGVVTEHAEQRVAVEVDR